MKLIFVLDLSLTNPRVVSWNHDWLSHKRTCPTEDTTAVGEQDGKSCLQCHVVRIVSPLCFRLRRHTITNLTSENKLHLQSLV